MRFSFVLVVLALSACDFFSQPAEPSLALDVLSPQPGEVKAFLSWRMRRTGPISSSRIFAAETGKTTVVREAMCGPGPTCEGRLDFPSLPERTYDVWAEMLLNDGESTTLTTEKQQVRIDARLITVAPLTLNDPKKIRIVVAGANELDPATLQNIRVEREFARLPYIDLPNFFGFGYGTSEFTVTGAMSGNFLELSGDFRGPATYTLHLETVGNTLGQTVKEPVKVEQAYLVGAESLGDIFISGVGIPPHFERLADGRIFLVSNGRIRALENGQWSDLATWNTEADAIIAPDGTPYLVSADSNGALVRRFSNGTWTDLPLAPCPVGRTGENNSFVATLATSRTGELYVATMRSPAIPIITDLILHKWDGSQWQQQLTRAYPSSSGFVTLLRFGDTIALAREDEFETISGLTVPNPKTTLDTLGPNARFSWRNLRHDLNGTPWLLGSYTDASIPGNEPAIGQSGIAMLKFENGSWTVTTKGALLEQAWKPLSDGSDLFIEEVAVRSWRFDQNGSPMVFTREQVNPSRIPVNARLIISAYSAVDGHWAPLPDAPSPMLADELHRVPSPFAVMRPMVLFDAVHDASGRMWTVSQAGDHQNVALTTFLVSSHR